MIGVRHTFVAADALLCHQVWIRPAETGRPVFIMDIDHEVVPGGFHDRFMEPCCPAMRPHMHESEFQPGDTPLLIQREDLVELLFESPVVHIQNHPDTVFPTLADNAVEVQIVVGVPPGVDVNTGSVGGL